MSVKMPGLPAVSSNNIQKNNNKKTQKTVRNPNPSYLQGNADRLQDKDTESLTEEK